MKPLVLAVAFAAGAALALPAAAKGNPEKGKAAAEKVCAACHGVDGAKPTAPENPILAGQHEDYLAKALSDYKSGQRKNAIMKSMVEKLSKQDIADLAAWFASQSSPLKTAR